jgi:hypothetical protein
MRYATLKLWTRDGGHFLSSTEGHRAEAVTVHAHAETVFNYSLAPLGQPELGRSKA